MDLGIFVQHAAAGGVRCLPGRSVGIGRFGPAGPLRTGMAASSQPVPGRAWNHCRIQPDERAHAGDRHGETGCRRANRPRFATVLEARLAFPDLLAEATTRGYLPPEVLHVLDSPDHFKAFFRSSRTANSPARQNEMTEMYKRMIPAIRADNPNHLIFLEPTAAVNSRAESGPPLPHFRKRPGRIGLTGP